MLAFRRLFTVLALTLLAAPALAQPNPRVALVIGNSEYQPPASVLPNPANDARAIADALARLGFSVSFAVNTEFEIMREALQAFSAAAAGAEVAVVFYAGHGMELNGVNYLIPIDARLQSATDLLFEAFQLNTVIAAVQQASVLGLVILDACRDNPFAARLQAAEPTRNLNRGLGDIEPPGTTLVAYAARDGTVARDGRGEHSPFTQALLDHIETPGLEVRFIFGGVRDDVLAATGGTQEPWLYGTLGGTPIYLAPPDAAATPPAVTAPSGPDAIRAAYQAAASINTPRAWEIFLAEYPTGLYAELAREALAALQTRVVPGGQPPPTQQAQLAPVPDRAVPPVTAPMPGTTFRDCPDCPEMMVVAGGRFLMGSPPTEPGRNADEAPVHFVDVSTFAIGLREVTRAEFAQFLTATNYPLSAGCRVFRNGSISFNSSASFWSPGYAQTDAHPAACLSWNDASAYVAWLSARTGRTYRLPSESEWEFAARAGSTASFAFGNDPALLCRYGNGADRTADWAARNTACSDGVGAATAPADAFAANAFGLFDMHGNLWEWLADCQTGDYYGAPVNGAPQLGGNCAARGLRGGAWSLAPDDLRSANRFFFAADMRSNVVGFRVATDLR